MQVGSTGTVVATTGDSVVLVLAPAKGNPLITGEQETQ